MWVDVLTNPLGKAKHQACLKGLLGTSFSEL